MMDDSKKDDSKQLERKDDKNIVSKAEEIEYKKGKTPDTDEK